MPETDKVQTDADTGDSPPETSDSAPPEETGQEVATPEGEVGAEVVEEEPEKLSEFHKHPDWIAREEKLKEQEIAAARADARAEAFQQQLQQAQAAPKEQPKTHTPEEVRRMHEDGEISDGVYLEYLSDQKATEKAGILEQNRHKQESEARALQMVPDIAQVGTPGHALFTQLITTGPYGTLFDANGQPTVSNAYEIVARDIKNQQSTSAATDTARVSEEQRRGAIDSQATNNEAPHGRGAEEEMGDATKQLDDRQAGYLAKKLGRAPTDKEAREYLDHAVVKTDEASSWPERAVR